MIKNCQRCERLIINDQCSNCITKLWPNDIRLHMEVAQTAKQIVLSTMRLGHPIHGNKWLTRDDNEDLTHMIAHLAAYQTGDRSEDHIGHCLTRGAMMKARNTCKVT